MPEKPDDDPFHDCEFGPDAVLGTRTFHDVLFTDDTETPVNVLTGETPAHSQATVEEAKAFAASIDTDTPQIALPASVETQVETQSQPFTAAAFFHFKLDSKPDFPPHRWRGESRHPLTRTTDY